jgi:2,4-dienoyl-CoA reductase-like NADH-dependent reductase (Old Yellow Enzyme family)
LRPGSTAWSTIGADRTALRVSPTASSGVDEGPVEESTELYHALLAELKDLSLAYLHVVEMPRQHKVVRKLRAACSGTFVLNPHKSDFEVHPKPHETCLDAQEAGADAVAFGPAFLVNPDLVTTARPRPLLRWRPYRLRRLPRPHRLTPYTAGQHPCTDRPHRWVGR